MIRSLYRWLLWLHPPSFRQEFAEEMLWIFDQAAGSRGVGPLFADALLSLLRQWGLRSGLWERPLAAGGARPASDGVPVFYTFGSSIPGAGALIHGGILSLAAFSAVSFAFVYGRYHQPPRTPFAGSSGFGYSQALAIRGHSIRSNEAWSKLLGFFGGTSHGARRVGSIYFTGDLLLDALDADHDFVISASEIANAPAALKKLDRNQDGKLSPAECGQAFAYQPVASSPNRPLADARGSVESARYRAVTVRERSFATGCYVPEARLVHLLLVALDADHDGEISADEMKNAPAALKGLDKNGDGKLTADELL